MFDLNNIVNAAINAAVTAAITPLVERVTALELTCATQHEGMVAMRDRITALETKLTEAALFTQTTNVTIPIDEAKMVEALNSQEWFWDKLRNFIDAGIESAIDTHCETYDHDSYDSAVSDLEDVDLNNIVSNDNLEDAVRDAVRNLTFEVSVS
jgi:hypothetical protein